MGGETSFQRGRPYAGRGAIHGARRQGMMLAARCQGSRAAAYRVKVTFDANGIADADCSCPVGDGGYCKHVAALLLVWAAGPEQFTEAQDVDASLQGRGKEELIALIKQMLRRQPDLESVLELPLPLPGAGWAAAGVETYRRQADLAFQRAGDEWGVEGAIADELSAMVEMGNDFLDQGNLATAAAVYEGVSAAVLEQAGMYSDEGGERRGVVGDCVEGLGACLGALTGATEREAVLAALFAVYRTDVEQGGAGWTAGRSSW